MKVAVCEIQVPACLSPTGQVIKVGDRIEYVKRRNFNGEGHLILADGKSVPDIFFNV